MTLSRPFGWLIRCNQTASFQINYSQTRTHSIFQTLSYAWHSIFFSMPFNYQWYICNRL